MKYLALLGILFLTGCDGMTPILGPGKPFNLQDVVDICTEAGGTLDTSEITIGVSNNIMTSSLEVSYKCHIINK